MGVVVLYHILGVMLRKEVGNSISNEAIGSLEAQWHAPECDGSCGPGLIFFFFFLWESLGRTGSFACRGELLKGIY